MDKGIVTLTGIKLDPRSGIPLYKQILNQFQLLILSPDVQTGSRLPSANETASFLCVNQKSVLKAYLYLIESGWAHATDNESGSPIIVSKELISLEQRLSLIKPQVEDLIKTFKKMGIETAEIINLIKNNPNY